MRRGNPGAQVGNDGEAVVPVRQTFLCLLAARMRMRSCRAS